jgi:uncharacterized protein YwbE
MSAGAKRVNMQGGANVSIVREKGQRSGKLPQGIVRDSDEIRYSPTWDSGLLGNLL